jgi:hypothetical protein
MRQRIELNTVNDVEEFNAIVSNVKEDVTLEGFDENGKPWSISGKSFLASLLIIDGRRGCTARNVDWNTIECVCDKDIYSLIEKWVVGSQMEA